MSEKRIKFFHNIFLKNVVVYLSIFIIYEESI